MRSHLVRAVSVLAVVCSAAAAQETLSLKFTPGTEFKQRDTVRLEQTLTIAGQVVPITVDHSIVYRTSYGKPSSDQTLVTSAAESQTVNLQAPGGIALIFDSSQPLPIAENPALQPYLNMFAASSKAKLTYTVDDAGKVLAVTGAKEMIRQAPQDAVQLLETEFSEERLVANYQQELAVLPSQPVKPGDAWNRTETMNLGNGQTLTFEMRYEYLGQVDQGSRKLDKIGAKAESVSFALAPNPMLPVTLKNSELKVDSSEGAILFDREQGRFVSRESKVHISGSLALVAGTNDLPATLDLKIEGRSEPAN
jgi:hypothetical protein